MGDGGVVGDRQVVVAGGLCSPPLEVTPFTSGGHASRMGDCEFFNIVRKVKKSPYTSLMIGPWPKP